MSNAIFSKEDIKAFKWEDLHNKKLTIFVYKSDNGLCVGGVDDDYKTIYLLHSEVKKEDT